MNNTLAVPSVRASKFSREVYWGDDHERPLNLPLPNWARMIPMLLFGPTNLR